MWTWVGLEVKPLQLRSLVDAVAVSTIASQMVQTGVHHNTCKEHEQYWSINKTVVL